MTQPSHYEARRASTALFAAMVTLSLASVASAQAARPTFVNGQAQIVPAFQDSAQWIRQELWVETEFDSDGDGKRDRMHVDVTRPAQTASEGLKVAVLYESSPYFAGTSGPRQSLWDVKQEVGAPPPVRTSQPEIRFQPVRPRISNSLVNQWVPPRLCGGPLGSTGHRIVPGLSHRRRRTRASCAQSRRRPRWW